MRAEDRIKREAKRYALTIVDEVEGTPQYICFMAGARYERNKTIVELANKLSELGFRPDDYNGRIIFNALQELKLN